MVGWIQDVQLNATSSQGHKHTWNSRHNFLRLHIPHLARLVSRGGQKLLSIRRPTELYTRRERERERERERYMERDDR